MAKIVEMKEKKQMISPNGYRKGFRDGIPIGLGYISIAFTFGMMAVSSGLSVGQAVVISMTNLTSAGQFAGLSLMITGAPFIEMALTQLIINMRYALMSLSLSQKLDKTVRLFDRFVISFGNTDEIFAVASGQPTDVGKSYLYGLMTAPYLGWTAGTLLGAAASTILPASIRSALGIAIYGMFLAIIIPPAKHMRSVCKVILLAVALSCIFTWTPVLNTVISSGFSIILCTLIAAGIGAWLFPIEEVK